MSKWRTLFPLTRKTEAERESEKLNGIPPIIKGTPPEMMEVPVSGFYIKTKESWRDQSLRSCHSCSCTLAFHYNLQVSLNEKKKGESSNCDRQPKTTSNQLITDMAHNWGYKSTNGNSKSEFKFCYMFKWVPSDETGILWLAITIATFLERV